MSVCANTSADTFKPPKEFPTGTSTQALDSRHLTRAKKWGPITCLGGVPNSTSADTFRGHQICAGSSFDLNQTWCCDLPKLIFLDKETNPGVRLDQLGTLCNVKKVADLEGPKFAIIDCLRELVPLPGVIDHLNYP